MKETPDHEPDILYTVKEAAALIRWYPKSIYRAIYQGRIKAVKLGRSQRIAAAEMDRLIREGMEK